MATSWDFEYRIWRTCRDPQGREDAEMFRTHQIGVARGYWQRSQDGDWMPRGSERGNVSPVMLFRRPASSPQDGPGGRSVGWTPFGALEGTTDVRCGNWPDHVTSEEAA